jgi:hypothetical protein
MRLRADLRSVSLVRRLAYADFRLLALRPDLSIKAA